MFLTVPVFLLFSGTGISRIMLIPHYRWMVEWFIRITELVTACLVLVLIVGQVIATNSLLIGDGDVADLHLCLLVAMVSIPCTVGLAVVIDI